MKVTWGKMITEIEGKGIYVSTIDTPFSKNLRCVNAAEGDIAIGSPSAALREEGYAAIISAGYNWPTEEEPEKLYGTQDLCITINQAQGLNLIIKTFFEDHPERNRESKIKIQNTAILPKFYEIISESATKTRVSGIGIRLEKHLFCFNKTRLDSIISLGDISEGDDDGLWEQGYIGSICAGIYDGSEKGLSTQDLYVTASQIKQIEQGLDRILSGFIPIYDPKELIF
jgi:hypothetical protein